MTAIDLVTPFRLDGRVAIVTGASSGLGDRFARVLHAAGATVVAAARRTERLQALADELGDRVLPVTCDVSVDADCERLVAAAVELGRIDVLVNNAGIGQPMAAESEPIDHFRGVVEVNLNGVFLLSQLAGRHMLERGTGSIVNVVALFLTNVPILENGGTVDAELVRQVLVSGTQEAMATPGDQLSLAPLLARSRGSIVNVASMLGLVASAPIKQASYCASKGAVVNLTRELGAQWGRKGVRVNALAPGWFPSEMTGDMFDDDASMDYVNRNCPMGRGGDPSELDGALLFLAADASSYVTGQVLTVDGGWTAR